MGGKLRKGQADAGLIENGDKAPGHLTTNKGWSKVVLFSIAKIVLAASTPCVAVAKRLSQGWKYKRSNSKI